MTAASKTALTRPQIRLLIASAVLILAWVAWLVTLTTPWGGWLAWRYSGSPLAWLAFAAAILLLLGTAAAVLQYTEGASSSDSAAVAFIVLILAAILLAPFSAITQIKGPATVLREATTLAHQVDTCAPGSPWSQALRQAIPNHQVDQATLQASVAHVTTLVAQATQGSVCAPAFALAAAYQALAPNPALLHAVVTSGVLSPAQTAAWRAAILATSHPTQP